ncbi:Dihydropyrimidinase-related protein 4 [Eumeta japonica]|uniref:Dihydropyrimidinase-related protein 4 n=1 Tax=Eumeta variegata TaxID=151549 RepID=A0A4C1T4D6_EUMVA|nr:Dihydropyrimidinase-related protein 4 [Eumeta japonica]
MSSISGMSAACRHAERLGKKQLKSLLEGSSTCNSFLTPKVHTSLRSYERSGITKSLSHKPSCSNELCSIIVAGKLSPLEATLRHQFLCGVNGVEDHVSGLKRECMLVFWILVALLQSPVQMLPNFQFVSPKGRIAVGSDADVVIWNPQASHHFQRHSSSN